MSANAIGYEVKTQFRVNDIAVLVVAAFVPGVGFSEAYCYFVLDDRLSRQLSVKGVYTNNRACNAEFLQSQCNCV